MARNAKRLIGSVTPGTPANGAVVRSEVVAGNIVTTTLYLNAFSVTMTKNGTTSGGGGTKLYDFPEGLILPLGGSTNLTVAGTGSKSNVASIGTVAAATDGTLTSTEADILPSTAATTTSGAGTCKMKSTSSVPTPGSPLDGTATAKDAILNVALNADATGSETLTFTGTVVLVWAFLGDN